MARKILIIACDTAPLDLISSQRVNHFIDFFSARDFKVDVLTSRKTAVDGPCTDQRAYARLRSKAVFHEVGLLKKGGAQPADSEGSPAVLSQRASRFRGIAKLLRKQLTYFLGQLIDYRTIWAINSITYYKKNLASEKYDVLISSSLPVGVNLVAAYIKKNIPSALWISDHRDPWSMNHLANYSRIAKQLDRFVEKKILSSADLLVAVSDEMASILMDLHKRPVQVVMNGFIEDEYLNLPETEKFFEKSDKTLNIVYAGNIYKGRRDPYKLLLGISKSKKRDLIKVHFFGSYMGNVYELIREGGFEDFCFIHGAIPRQEALSVCRTSDFNIFLESGADDAKGVLTGKVFELIALGRPVISIGPGKYFKTSEILSEAGLLVHWDDFGSGDIYDFLASKRRARAPEELRRMSSDYSRNGQVQKILSFIQSSSGMNL